MRHDVVNQMVNKRGKYEKNISYLRGSGIDNFEGYTKNKRLEGIWGDHVELQAAADLYGVDINVYQVSTGAERPNLIVESTGEIEYLPISLWFEDDNHYHAFVDAPKEEAEGSMVELPQQVARNNFLDESADGHAAVHSE